MSSATNIEWCWPPGYTGATWNPIVGCKQIASGCGRCYAKSLHDKRHKAYLAGAKLPAQYAKPFEDVQLFPDRLGGPLRRKKPTFYFVNSVSDVFHEDVPFEFVAAMYGVMAACPQHQFCILTKRTTRMREFMEWWAESVERARAVFPHDDDAWRRGQCLYGSMLRFSTRPRAGTGQIALGEMGWPLPNVIHGYSASTQADLDAGMPDLLATPSALWCLSLEPLIGPVDVAGWLPEPQQLGNGAAQLSWCLIGGESGPGARPCDVAWIRSIVAQCKAAGVPCFVKQLGAKPFEQNAYQTPSSFDVWCSEFMLKDRKGGNPAEWPADLRVRQFPALGVTHG